MGPNPLVSVVVPLFNYQQFIADCIKSIKNQSYKNWELIVVDDCSTDNSYAVASRFQCDNIRVVRLKKNRGYSKAKNEGIILSKGDLITCLDADDMMTKQSIALRVRALIDSDADMVHANAVSIKGGIGLSECYKINLSNPKLKRMRPYIHAQTVILKRQVHIKYGLYEERLRSKSDKEMWIRLLGPRGRTPLIQAIKIKIDVAYYRRHDESMMSMRRGNKKYDRKIVKMFSEIVKQKRTRDNTRFLVK